MDVILVFATIGGKIYFIFASRFPNFNMRKWNLKAIKQLA